MERAEAVELRDCLQIDGRLAGAFCGADVVAHMGEGTPK